MGDPRDFAAGRRQPTNRYKLTLADLRRECRLLEKIEVLGSVINKDEQLVGRNALGEIVVRVKGKVTPGNVIKFRNEYQRAVAAGIIKQKELHA